MTAALPTLVQSSANNGTLTPATPGSLTVTAGNTLLLYIVVQGTNPTITTPAGWTLILQRTATAALTVALFSQINTAGGATNPSSALGGTVAGWVAVMFEFNGMIPTTTQLGTTGIGYAATTTLNNVFAVGVNGNFSGNPIPQENLLWVYLVARLTATITPTNIGIPWSASQQPQAGVQGISSDFYFGVNQGPGPFPSCIATLGASVVAVQIAAWFTTAGAFAFVFAPGGAVFVGQGGNPAGSLQTPQPQGVGNFYSGSSGSF